MLKIILPKTEYYDESTETFINAEEIEIELEHSLRSVSKWEEFYKVPFLNTSLDSFNINNYIKMMDTKENVTDDVLNRFTKENYESVKNYIQDSHTATTFVERDKGKVNPNKVTTVEEIYYLMIEYGIPFECQDWHFNKLLTLIHVCGIKNNPKKMSKKDTMLSNHQLNQLRRKSWGTKG